jgi:Protein of unknown function (DUF742)
VTAPREVNGKMRSKRIRPYTLTGGRTRPRHELLVEALVSVPRYDPALPDSLMPESRALSKRAHTRVSIAELSVAISAPLGVVRVLLSDLAAQGAIYIHPTAHTYHHDREMLGRILDGLERLRI